LRQQAKVGEEQCGKDCFHVHVLDLLTVF
jgi:hypothetical protein